MLVEESHRMGYRVAAHCEGLPGTEIAIEEGIDTIEHGMYLNQRPDLLERMARDGQVLVPTLSCLYGMAGLGERIGSSPATTSTRAARAAASSARRCPPGRRSWSTWRSTTSSRRAHPRGRARGRRDDRDGLRLGPAAPQRARVAAHDPHGPDAAGGLIAATSAARTALGLEDHVGTLEVGKLADLLVVDGDPLERPELLLERESIWLVTRLGAEVAGTSLERDPAQPEAA